MANGQITDLEIFAEPEFVEYVRNIPVPEPWTGNQVLPDKTIGDIRFEYLLGAQNNPVMARIIGYDSPAQLVQYGGQITRLTGELPPIKQMSKISEVALIRFLTARANSAQRQDVIDDIFDLVDKLVLGVQGRVEWLRWQALSEDVVTYSDDGVEFAFDYQIDATLQIDIDTGLDGDAVAVTGLDLDPWNVAAADPFNDIGILSGHYRDTTGFDLGQLILSKKALAYVAGNQAMRDAIRGTGAGVGSGPLSIAEINAAMDQYGYPRISTYDGVVYHEQADGTRVQQRPLAEHKAVGLPVAGVKVGDTLWGPTAEARSLIGGPSERFAPGLWATAWGQVEPPGEFVKASATAFPSLPGADKIMQLTLWAP